MILFQFTFGAGFMAGVICSVATPAMFDFTATRVFDGDFYGL